MKGMLFIITLMLCLSVNAQFQWTSPFSEVKRTPNSYSRVTGFPLASVNTFKVNVSLPGYWYSNGTQQNAVIGLGYSFEHYVADSLIYSVGPYVWYKSPVPLGSTKLPIGYGAAGTYKGKVLLGVLTPDFTHWGPVLSLNFSFGNGGISF